MTMINALLVFGLLASIGSLVDAQLLPTDAQFYRGRVRDYNDVQSFGSTHEDSTSGSSSYAAVGTDDYDYPSSIYTEQKNPTSTPDYVYDATKDDNTPSTFSERRNPTGTYQANSHDYTPSTYTERTTPTNLDSDVAERSDDYSSEEREGYDIESEGYGIESEGYDIESARKRPRAPSRNRRNRSNNRDRRNRNNRKKPVPAQLNPIDACWMHNTKWNRKALARCAIGFGKNAMGGANGPIYVVTDDSDDDLVNPKKGTLRYGVLKNGPLWITFARDMNIKLKNELIFSSFKTIDGRGAKIHITGGSGFTLQYVEHVIVHSIYIHDLKGSGPAVIRSNSTHSGHRGGSDGDAINIFGSHDIWVDHCYFARGPDGLVDAVMGSTRISVTNNFFEQHDKTMLFGAHGYDTMDDNMQVSVAYNHFAPGLIERVPRVRHGYAHVFNNYYASWGMYAIGGSEGPTILSEGNVYRAPDIDDHKQVTKRLEDGDEESFKRADQWNWQSRGDKFLNGAYFVASGTKEHSIFGKAASHDQIMPADMVRAITSMAGPLV